MSRPLGCQSTLMTADGYVTTIALKNVYELVISCEGATAGDKIALRDGGPTGTIRTVATVSGANGTISVPFGRYGIRFASSIYYSEQAAAAGKIRTTVVWD